MKVLANVSSMLTYAGLTIFGAGLLFTSGPLTILGWLVAVPLFIGGAGMFSVKTVSVYQEYRESHPPVNPSIREKKGQHSATTGATA